MTPRSDERSSGGSRRQRGGNVDNPWATGVEVNRDLSGWVSDLDLSFTVQRERIWTAAKRDGSAMFEQASSVYGNIADETRGNWDRYDSCGRRGVADRDPGARATVARLREEGAAEAGDADY
jgi:hypothetical protein